MDAGSKPCRRLIFSNIASFNEGKLFPSLVTLNSLALTMYLQISVTDLSPSEAQSPLWLSDSPRDGPRTKLNIRNQTNSNMSRWPNGKAIISQSVDR